MAKLATNIFVFLGFVFVSIALCAIFEPRDSIGVAWVIVVVVWCLILGVAEVSKLERHDTRSQVMATVTRTITTKMFGVVLVERGANGVVATLLYESLDRKLVGSSYRGAKAKHSRVDQEVVMVEREVEWDVIAET